MLRMIRSVEAIGGAPTAGFQHLEECFTYEPSLKSLMLWYNIDGTTRIEISSWCGASGTFELTAAAGAVSSATATMPIYRRTADIRRSDTSDIA